MIPAWVVLNGTKMSVEFWDKRASQYDKQVRKHESLYDETIASIASLLSPTDSLLDFGCASGEMSLDLAAHVERVHGIDISSKMIELAKVKAAERRIENVDFDQRDEFDPTLEEGSYSAIAALYVLHLVDDIPKTLARLSELLAPGGFLVSQTPCLGQRGRLFRSLINLAVRIGLAPPIRSLSTPELEAYLSVPTLEITESKMWDQKSQVQWIVARRT